MPQLPSRCNRWAHSKATIRSSKGINLSSKGTNLSSNSTNPSSKGTRSSSSLLVTALKCDHQVPYDISTRYTRGAKICLMSAVFGDIFTTDEPDGGELITV